MFQYNNESSTILFSHINVGNTPFGFGGGVGVDNVGKEAQRDFAMVCVSCHFYKNTTFYIIKFKFTKEHK